MANDAPIGPADAPKGAKATGGGQPRDVSPMSPTDAKQPPPFGPNRYEAVLSTPPAVAAGKSDRPAEAVETPPITDKFWADTKTPLGADKYAPGVYDPHDTLQVKRPEVGRKEKAIAQLEADGGAVVHFRKDSPVEGERNPDVVTRRGPDQEGRVTEYKTLESGSQRAVYRGVHSARENLRDEPGDAVIDARRVQLTRETADAGYDQAVRNARTSPVPENVYFYLGDGTVHQRSRES